MINSCPELTRDVGKTMGNSILILKFTRLVSLCLEIIPVSLFFVDNLLAPVLKVIEIVKNAKN